MLLKVASEFPCSYHECQRKPFDILLYDFNAFEHISHEIDKFLNFVFLMYDYIAHHLVRTYKYRKMGELVTGHVRMDSDVRKAFKLENASS